MQQPLPTSPNSGTNKTINRHPREEGATKHIYHIMINYSVTNNTNQQTGKDIYYALPQYEGLVTLSDFAKHIRNHGSTFSAGTIQAVITDMSQCLRELLLNGNKVQLGDLGNFSAGLHSQTAASADEFTAANIQVVSTRFEPGEAFEDMRQDAELNLVSTRKNQALAVSAEKSGKTLTVVEA